MAQEWAKAFYDSRRWKKCRNAYIQARIRIDGGMCEECHEKLGKIVHHRITLTQENISDSEVSLNHKYLEYVCKECHDNFDGHGLNKSLPPLCIFDKDGQPISLREIDQVDGGEN